MEMKLCDHADGVAGHFCIGKRISGSDFWEFYNKGHWQSAGQVFTSKESAEFKLAKLRNDLGPTSEQICEALVRHLEVIGSDVFEKNFMTDGKILATVFCMVGPNAERFNRMMTEWLKREGFKLDSEEVKSWP